MLLLGVGESPGSPIYEPQDEELGLFRRNPAAGLAAA
jgi:hypothetical protein